MTTNLQQRFEAQFSKNAVHLRIVGKQTGYVFEDNVTDPILAFIAQEFELAALEVEKTGDEYTQVGDAIVNATLYHAAAIIRNRISG